MLLFALLALLLVVGCERKATNQGHAWASHHDTAPIVTALPIPLEAPVEVVRVPNSGLSCALDDVLAAKCRRCHTKPMRHGAPFPLLTWEDTHAPMGEQVRFQVMGRAVKSGFMPYNVAANPPVERLTEDEKRIITDWVEAGAPKAACSPAHVDK